MPNELEVKEIIRERKAKYCRYLDTKQYDKWENLFSADAKVTFYKPDGTVMMAYDNVEKFFEDTRHFFATTVTVHQTHNSEIEFRSDTEASAIWAMEDWHRYMPTPEHPAKSMHGYGHYYETWKLIDGEWVLKSLELRRLLVDIE
jgi:hypothetical protein